MKIFKLALISLATTLSIFADIWMEHYWNLLGFRT